MVSNRNNCSLQDKKHVYLYRGFFKPEYKPKNLEIFFNPGSNLSFKYNKNNKILIFFLMIFTKPKFFENFEILNSILKIFKTRNSNPNSSQGFFSFGLCTSRAGFKNVEFTIKTNLGFHHCNFFLQKVFQCKRNIFSLLLTQQKTLNSLSYFIFFNLCEKLFE